MPFSDAQGKDVIKGWIKRIEPRYVLDVGPGAGIYADIIRGVCEDVHIIGIEAWAPYIEKFSLSEKYDQIIVSDIRYVDQLYLGHNDLVIAGDVIEHLPKSEAVSLLKQLYYRNNNLIVSFPVLHLSQGAWQGNPFEEHIDHWTYDEFMGFTKVNSMHVVDSGHGDVLAWFWLN